MSYEPFECIDAGTEYCPCHLAETGDCILCSQLQGCKCCDCPHWKGTCIYQEFVWNNYKAKAGRKYYSCKIINKVHIEENLLLLEVEAPAYIVSNLVYPGSFVFVRHPHCEQCFDSPISIMDTDKEKNTFTIAIEIKGIKTKTVDLLNQNDNLLVKGPFWNGILGLRHVYRCKNSTCVLIARGIGQAPMIPVLKKLYANGNKIITIVDKARNENTFIDKYLEKYNCEVLHCNTFVLGKTTIEFKELLIDLLLKEDATLVHCDGADILNYQVMKIVEKVNESKVDAPKIEYACCNNAKMCCGEGVCGCCTRKNNDHKLRRLCKEQTDPKFVLEGRRLF